MRIVSISAAVFALALVGCAAEEGVVAGSKAPVTVVATSNSEITPQTKLHCHKESPPGSNMIQNVCETEQSQADREALQRQLMNNVQANGGVHGAPSGGH